MSTPDNRTPLRALIYNRVSSDPTGHQVSVTSQDAENRAFCAREGWEVAATITDNDRSASRHAAKEREGYRAVQTALAGHTHGRVDVIVCWEASRAQRDMADYVSMRDLCATHGVRLAYKGRVYDLTSGDDRFATGLDVLVAEREAELIRERAQRGHRASAAIGRPRGQVPYGYRRDYTVTPFAQIPDPDTAPVVQGVVARLLAGDALYAIAADLNRAGVPTPQGHKELAAGIDRGRLWSSATIRVLLASQSMTGVRTHLGVAHTEPTWEPIVAAADWWEAQAVLGDPHRARHHRGVTPRHLLSGIAECGVCGAWLRAATNRGREVYQCAGHGVGDPRGKGHVSRPRQLLDDAVEVYAVARLRDPALLERVEQRRSGDGARVSAAAAEMAELEVRLGQFRRLAATRTGMAAEQFAAVVDDLAAQIERAREAMTRSSGLPPQVVEAAGPNAERVWLARDVVWRRQVLRALLRVRVLRSTRPRGVRGFDPSTIDIVDVT